MFRARQSGATPQPAHRQTRCPLGVDAALEVHQNQLERLHRLQQLKRSPT